MTPPSDSDLNADLEANERLTRLECEDGSDLATIPFGQMRISKGEISYVGGAHWNAILSNISELKREVEDDTDNESDEDTSERGTIYQDGAHPASRAPQLSTGLGIMLGNPNALTKEELIAAVPEKRVADRLLSLWFNSPDPFKPIIHAPTFQEEYKRFWKQPRDTPVMWLGLLFAILSLASSFGLRDPTAATLQAKQISEDTDKYHQLAASAAVLADFTKPKQYTIECLMLYGVGFRSNNAFVNFWLMIGMTVRLALRMGYHRDPDHYPAISVFHGEMRRRVWSIVSMIDILLSFQIGLPSTIKAILADTKAPRNLLDRDFHVASESLPPGRSIEELTPSSYTRAKIRLVRVFGEAAELSHQTIAPLYEETTRLDLELETARAAVPPLLQMPEDCETVTDPAEQLMCRFNLDLMFMKVKMVLHRRYMLTPLTQLTSEEQRLGIGRSRKICIESGLRALQHHHRIYAATQPGGQLETVKWYMGALSTHDFLLAAMIICLELSRQISYEDSRVEVMAHYCPHRAAMLEALEKSHSIWSETSKDKGRTVQFQGKDDVSSGEAVSDEVAKASRAMEVMLRKVKARLDTNGTPQPTRDTTVPMATAMGQPDVSHAMPDAQPPPDQQRFFGIMSSHQWDSEGLPQDYTAGSSFLPINVANQNGGSNVLSTLPYDNNIASNGLSLMSDTSSREFSDFSLIGNMLETPLDFTWGMFDSEVIAGADPGPGSFVDDSMDAVVGLQNCDTEFGDAMAGGYGPITGDNATLNLGDGSLPPGEMFSGFDFDAIMPDDAGSRFAFSTDPVQY